MRSSAQAAEGLQRRVTLKRASSEGLGSAQGESDWACCAAGWRIIVRSVCLFMLTSQSLNTAGLCVAVHYTASV